VRASVGMLFRRSAELAGAGDSELDSGWENGIVAYSLGDGVLVVRRDLPRATSDFQKQSTARE